METHKKVYYFYAACLVFLISSKDIYSMNLAKDAQQLATLAISGVSNVAHHAVNKSKEAVQNVATNATHNSAESFGHTAHGLIDHAADRGNRLAASAIGQGAAQTSILMNQATGQSKEVINQASLFSWFCLPRFTQLVRYCKLSAFEGIQYGSREYHDGIKHAVAATQAVTRETKKATHEIIEHAGEKTKQVFGTGVAEAKLATKDCIDHSYEKASLFRDETLISTIAGIATVGGLYGVYANSDNPSPKKSLLCGLVGTIGLGHLYYKIQHRTQQLKERSIKPILTKALSKSNSIPHRESDNLVATATVIPSHSPALASQKKTTHQLKKSSSYGSIPLSSSIVPGASSSTN